MRFQKKYKLFNLQQKNRSIDLPVRILKFKHTKWNSLSSHIRICKRLNYFFRLSTSTKSFDKKKSRKLKKDSSLLKRSKNDNINKRVSFTNLKLQALLKKWERFKDNYKECLDIKRSFYQSCDFNVRYKPLKKQIFSGKNLSNKEHFFKKILKPQFRVDILLYKLRFCKSSFESRALLNNGLISINSKPVQGNYFVKSGDIITLNYKLDYDLNLKRLKKSFLLHNFLEIDYYTGSIIVLRSFDEISTVELSFFFKKYFDIYKFRFSFK